MTIYPVVSKGYTPHCSVHQQYPWIIVCPPWALSLSPKSLDLCKPACDLPQPKWMVVVVRNRLSLRKGIEVHLQVLSISMSWCFTDFTQVLFDARLMVCTYPEILWNCRPYDDVAYFVTVTTTNMIDKILWGCGTLISFVVWIWHQVSCRAMQRSQLVLKSSADLCRGLSCFKIGLLYKSNLIASWMHLHHCRCFLQHLRKVLQNLRALCLPAEGPGSIWKYLGAQGGSTRVSGRLAWGFQTNVHFADDTSLLQSCLRCMLYCNIFLGQWYTIEIDHYVGHREAVFGPVIYRPFQVYHQDILCTCVWTQTTFHMSYMVTVECARLLEIREKQRPNAWGEGCLTSNAVERGRARGMPPLVI